MPRLLLNRAAGALIPYPREDNEPVVGLDRTAYQVVEVMRDPKPEYDPATHFLQPLEPVISITDPDGDDVNGTVTYGWELTELPTPPPPTPEPDWSGFRLALLDENGFGATFAAAAAANPMAAVACASALETFQNQGIYENYLLYLQRLMGIIADLQSPAASAEIAAEFLVLAQRCHLPEGFLNDYAAMIQSAAP